MRLQADYTKPVVATRYHEPLTSAPVAHLAKFPKGKHRLYAVCKSYGAIVCAWITKVRLGLRQVLQNTFSQIFLCLQCILETKIISYCSFVYTVTFWKNSQPLVDKGAESKSPPPRQHSTTKECKHQRVKWVFICFFMDKSVFAFQFSCASCRVLRYSFLMKEHWLNEANMPQYTRRDACTQIRLLAYTRSAQGRVTEWWSPTKKDTTQKPCRLWSAVWF